MATTFSIKSSQKHLFSTDEVARGIIENDIVPTFIYMRKMYPRAAYLDLAFVISQSHMCEVITYAHVYASDDADNPSSVTTCDHAFGENISKVLSTVSFILKEQKQHYKIDANTYFVDGNSLYIFTSYKH